MPGGTLSLFFLLTNPFQSVSSLSEWWCVVLLIYTISLSIICVSWEEVGLIESNQKILYQKVDLAG